MKQSDKYNSSGCLDLTAYQALKNIEHEEAEKRKSENRRKKQIPKRRSKKSLNHLKKQNS